MATCPHCFSEIPERATVCKECGAEKAYAYWGGERFGRTALIIRGIVLPGILALPALIFAVFEPLLLAWVFIMAIPVCMALMNLSKGERWFR